MTKNKAPANGKKRDRKTSHKFTPKKRETFLGVLSLTCNVSASAAKAGISRRRAYQVRAKDEEFARLWEEAIDEGIELLELEARRRAFEGTGKPVFYKGSRCGVIQEYSDTLMIFLLKAHKPDKYKDQLKVDHDITGQLAQRVFGYMNKEHGGANGKPGP